MGLDLIPLGRAKPGHEAEWSALMEKIYGEQVRAEAPEDTARRNDISIMPYEVVGALRVGFDKAADDWALEQKSQDHALSDADHLKQMHGITCCSCLKIVTACRAIRTAICTMVSI